MCFMYVCIVIILLKINSQQHANLTLKKQKKNHKINSNLQGWTNVFKYKRLNLKSQNSFCYKIFWFTGAYIILTEKSSHCLKPNTSNSLISRNHICVAIWRYKTALRTTCVLFMVVLLSFFLKLIHNRMQVWH